jgi:hypothetical protein
VPLTKSSANSPTTTAKKLKTGPSSGKGVGLRQLTEQHRDKLIPTREALGCFLGAKGVDGFGKLVAIDER